MSDKDSAGASRAAVKASDGVLAGGGEAGVLARATDWSQTPLGPVEGWSQALRSAAALVLNNEWGLLLWWGPEFVQIYNDAYLPVLGDKHPRAMGQRFRDCWVEVFHILGPMAEQPFRGGPASKGDDVPLLINRKVRGEETHFRLVYSPVPDETVEPTRIGGVLAIVTEITEQVYAQRQLRTLRELVPHGTVQGRTVEAACADAAAALAKNAWDVPFALLYLLDEEGRSAHLTATAGFSHGESGPRVVDLSAGTATSRWQALLAEAAHEKKIVVMGDLGAAGFAIPWSPWSELPREAIALPLASPDQPNASGVLVCGVSPHRVLDAGYRTFFELAAGQVTTAIRDARALEQERKRLQALAEIDRAKTTFFSNVSHEFRTPLTLMLGPQRDALESGGTLGGAELEGVHRNTVRLLKLVNTLLEFSRAEAGRARATYQPTDLAVLTRDLASAFQSTVERGGLRFEVDCPPLPEAVYVDRDMWERIVLNLLSNAFKFTFAGSVTVRQHAEGRNVVLEVADTGVGIPGHELARVFQRFHRIEGAQARTHEGSGIGLALVHDTVALHGGRVTVESQLGQGTTFRVSLPFGPAHLPADQIGADSALGDPRTGAAPYVSEALRWLPAPVAEAPRHVPDSTVGTPRVLVADDSADMRDYITRLLQPHWTVEVATDGAEALARVRAAPPDLILADVMMPNLDGFQLLRQLRADPNIAAIPLIMLSARAGEEARLQGLQAGADDYLVKPFSARELQLRVRTHLEAAAQRRTIEAERHRLRALLAQLPASVNFLRGPELVVEFLHPVAAAALGEREVLGKPLLEAVPEFRSQEAATLLRTVVETGEPIIRNEQLVHIDDGRGKQEDRVWSSVYLPVRDQAGGVEGVMTFDLDVTAQVEARRQLEAHSGALRHANQEAEQARAQAEAANRSKDEFMAMLGHELRNPLSPIVTALQLMRMKGTATGEQAVIERQVGHLIRLVDDLLDISRITRGKIELRRARTELAPLVLRGLEVASPLIEQRRQRVDVRVAPLGLEIEVDSDRIAQVVANLLTNASKYSEPGATIHVSAGRTPKGVRLDVRDEGIGIAPELLGRVFDVFYQQPQSLDRSKGGLGLGLAIVRNLVELHGGTVRAESAGPQRGSRFVVELPLAPGAEEIDPMAGRTPMRDARPDSGPRIEKRILVVDDHTDAAESIADLLRMLGSEIATAHDGPEALRVARTFKPDVCLVDIGLPVMDGYELARQLRESRSLASDGRLIAVTGYGQDADRERSREAGFDAHLVKPLDVELLARAVGAH